MPEKIAIEIGYSSSPLYPDVIEMSKTMPEFKEAGEGKSKKIRFVWDSKNPNSLPIYKKIIGWRNVQFYLNGSMCTRDIILKWFWCYVEREPSFNKKIYCLTDNLQEFETFYPFGCHEARELEFYGKPAWLKFGELKTDGVWVFDKPRIASYINYRLYFFRFCPALDTKWISSFLENFPESVNPRKDKDWSYIPHSEYDQHNIVGAGPKDNDAALRILKSIFKKMSGFNVPLLS